MMACAAAFQKQANTWGKAHLMYASTLGFAVRKLSGLFFLKKTFDYSQFFIKKIFLILYRLKNTFY